MGRHSGVLGGFLLAVLVAVMVLYIDFLKELIRSVLKTSSWWTQIQKVVQSHPWLFAGLLLMMVLALTCTIWEARKF